MGRFSGFRVAGGGPLDIRRPGFVRWVTVTCGVLGSVSCATFVPLTPERVDRVPAGHYQVAVSELRAGSHEYNAVLFNLATAAATLDLPTVERGDVATPDDYAAGFQAGCVVYAVRDAAGTVTGYLMVPAQARVTVWSRPGRQGGLVVTVMDLPGTPEAAGGGGGAM
jgi:hypothetical protein